MRNHLGQVCLQAAKIHAGTVVHVSSSLLVDNGTFSTGRSTRCKPSLLQYECRLCLTLHTNEGNYLAHTQGERGCIIMRSYHMRIGCKYCQCCFLPETLSLASAPVSSAGKRHQQNLAKRAAREAAEKPVAPAPQRRVAIKKTVRIGRPGYRVTKQFDHDTGARGLLFQVLLLHHKLP